jgi:hypothetical protein
MSLNRLSTAALALSTALSLSACMTGRDLALADRPIALGRDDFGNVCTATRTHNGVFAGKEGDSAFVITCSGNTGARPLGRVQTWVKSRAPAPRTELCGADMPATLEGIGAVRVSRCLDELTGLNSVVIAFDRGNRRYRGAASATLQGHLEQLMRVVAGVAPTTALAGAEPPKKTIATEALAEVPETAKLATAVPDIDVEVAIREGSALNRRGEYVRASRELNDAISRLPSDTAAAERIQLSLEAGLGNSNTRQFEAADRHFAEADRLLSGDPNVARRAFLERKRNTYLAMHALNQRDFTRASDLLASGKASDPLQDPIVLAELNQVPGSGLEAASSIDGEVYERLVLEAQRNWSHSVALSARERSADLPASREALNASAATLRALLSYPIDPTAVLWLVAQVERQDARLDELEGQASPQARTAALANFDCAIDALRGTIPANEQACAVQLPEVARVRLTRLQSEAAGPILAETQLERAGLLARTGAPEAQVQAAYDQAIDDLIRLSRSGGPAPVGLEAYLDLLIQRHAADPNSGAAESFFKAAQALRASPREFHALQSVATADPATAAKVRELANLDRDIVNLRADIAATQDPVRRGELEAQRDEKERAVQALNAQLQGTSYERVSDRPATIAEIQAALNPGEVFWKVAQLRTRLYGVVIGKDGVTIYPAENTARAAIALARLVRRSAFDETSDRLPFFNVGAAASLFELLAGPARDRLLAADAIAVDPSGPLEIVPVGVLVTNLESAREYQRQRRERPNDYSRVDFLARKAALQTALSPRSFLIARALKPSEAPQPLIGLGEHVIPTDAQGAVSFGNGCQVERQNLIALSVFQEPISAARLDVVANALGVPNAPKLVGAEFTDRAIRSSESLDRYQVLHFSTHGIAQVRQGCDIPPSLITTAGPDGSDGLLTYEEIARLDLDANLVVLSACDTSASVAGALAQRSGNEADGAKALSGLVRSFLAAKARAVVATHWQVSIEEESDRLFREFYTRGRTVSIGEALKGAQVELMSDPRYSHPFFWGAYFVVGDAGKRMLSPAPAQVASR